MKRYVFLTVLSLLLCSFVFADGDSRKPTQTEKDFNKLILNTFAKAVPPGPGGWERTPDSTEIGELQVVYSAVNQPLKVEYHIIWEDAKRKREADVQFQEELIKLSQKPGFTGEGVDELQKKMEPHDVKVRIDITANLTSQGIYEKVNPASAIAGGMVYQSQSQYKNGWNEGSTYVFFGKGWKMTSNSSGGTYIDFKPEKWFPSSTVVQNIVVRVQADSKRAEQIIQKIDWEALKKLIKN
jgi:hypothetical protein